MTSGDSGAGIGIVRSGAPFARPWRPVLRGQGQCLTQRPRWPRGVLASTSQMVTQQLPRPLIWFSFAGLLPQALCLALILGDSSLRWIALAACFYAALILSFLGGMWWMAAMLGGLRSARHYAAAVLPSLFGLAALLPWCLGWTWPGPSLVALGLALVTSLLVDRALADQVLYPPGWLRLRTAMSWGLGITTLLIAAL